MEASKRIMCAMVMMVLLLVGSVQASCTIKNSSSNDIELLPTGTNLKIKVKVGAVVTVAPIYLKVIIKNVGTGNKSNPTQLTDGTVYVCVNGNVKGTISIYVGGLIGGVISVIANGIAIIVGL